MSTARHTVRDLIEEAKKRVVLFLICIVGLSYLMSLTSSSVWVNLPAAAVLIIFFRYVSLDFDIHKKSTTGGKLPLINSSPKKMSVKPHDFPLEKINWRSKVNSPATEEAIDHFTRHLVSEWVTDLWYSRITPDKDGPEELVQIINNVFGEISSRARDINLIELLTRDIINLFCNHLELYRTSVSKIGRQELKKLPLDHQDIQLKQVLAAESKLHPALFSPKAEHKVLQHLVNGLMVTTFRPKDLQCYFFQCIARELLACAVFRPVLNLANPRFINEKIESLVLSFAKKADKEAKTSTDQVMVKSNAPSKPSIEHLSGLQDRSAVGLELVQFKHGHSKIASDHQVANNEAACLKHQHSSGCSSVGTHETALIPGLVNNGVQASQNTQTNHADQIGSSISKGEWGQILDIISQKKRQALAPEHLENVWAKGRNYRKKEGSKQFPKQNANCSSTYNNGSKQAAASSGYLKKDKPVSHDASMINNAVPFHENLDLADNFIAHSDMNDSVYHISNPYNEKSDVHREEIELASESSYETEDEESNNVTGLGSPGTRVWDSKNKRNASVSHIRHPLETSDLHSTKIKGKSHVRHPRTLRTPSGRKKIRPINQKTPLWQEIERSSFLLGERQDLLNELTKDARVEELSDDPDVEIVGRIHSGASASSSLPSIPAASESSNLSLKSPENSVLADSFLKLRCEVLGANIVKSGSGTFAVYSIAVTDANNHCWSIKRRFRHFEELHRRLKEFPEYNLSLPPKHFLSSGLDAPVVQERCTLLDKYLKRLLELPTISGSIEVWDFLSVDSQTYVFSDSLSIMQTLSVDLDVKPPEKSAKVHNSVEVASCQLPSQTEQLSSVNGANALSIHLNKKHTESENVGMRKRKIDHDNSGSDTNNMVQSMLCASKNENDGWKGTLSGVGDLPKASQIPEVVGDVTFPAEWATPSLSVPILDLIDVIFQLKDGGWIRRQAFWVAKQLLQLGMGDAFDDWLIDKIQLLRKGSVVASAIKRIEQILWPDGIFITKHPNRKPPMPVSSPGSSVNNFVLSEQQLEDARRAKFVYELIIDKAPAPLVGLVGRKEYEHCAQDIYFFLQSVVCLKQLTVELLELLLLSAFPELEEVIRQCHEEKDQFGAFEE